MFQRGQSFAIFKLLIGAIVALAILVIIVGVINYFENLRVQISEKRLVDGLISAANAPGELVVAEKLTFEKSLSFSRRFFSTRINVEQECIELDSLQGSSVIINPESVSFNSGIQIDVFFKCSADSFSSFCPLSCAVSFGKAPD